MKIRHKFLIVLCTVVLFINSGKPQDEPFSLIGEALEAGSPCSNGFLFMERYIGGPPSKENYWNGTLDFDLFKNLPEARVTLRLSAPASIFMNEEDGRVLADDKEFHLSFFRQDDGKFRGKFVVRGRPKGDFPNVEVLHLNNVNVCKNLTQWKPSLLGATNTGSVDLVGTDTFDASKLSPCGRRMVEHQALITNGYPSQEGDWPWHAAIYHVDSLNSRYKCGGSLISSRAVTTAAHCVTDGNSKIIIAARVLVRLGQHNRVIASPNTQEFRVFKIEAHEDYDASDLKNDIAILKLSTEAAFTKYVQPACLWNKRSTDLNEIINEAGYVVGWGLNEHDVLAEILSQGLMPVVSLTTCLKSNRHFFGNFLRETNYCAGFRNGTSVCNGDSGGGMFFKRDSVFYLRGIVSLSVSRDDRNVCDTKHYVVFTDTAKFLDWIETKTQD